MSKSVYTYLCVLHSTRNRWSPSALDPKPILEMELEAMLRALRWSFSCLNKQLWQLLITHRDDLQHQVLLDCVSEENRSWAQQAPLLILIVARLLLSRNGKVNRHAGYDLGQAIAQLGIQATSLQIYLHQIGGFSVEAAKEAFGLNKIKNSTQ